VDRIVLEKRLNHFAIAIPSSAM